MCTLLMHRTTRDISESVSALKIKNCKGGKSHDRYQRVPFFFKYKDFQDQFADKMSLQLTKY